MVIWRLCDCLLRGEQISIFLIIVWYVNWNSLAIDLLHHNFLISNYFHICTLLLCPWHTFYFINIIIVCCMYLYQSTWADLTWLDLTRLDLTCRSSSYATIVCCISILIYCTLHYHSVWWFYTLSLYACVHLVIFHLTLHHLVSCIMLCSTTSHTILYFSTVSFCMVFQ